jgi:hypothetical protein
VLLQLAGEFDVLEVVEAVNGVAKGLVVFLFNEQAVVCLVHSLDVELPRAEYEDK